MPQMVSCPICASKLKVPDSAAGRKVKCPKCKNVIAVPADPEEPEAFAQVRAERPQPPPLRDRRVTSTGRRDLDDRDDDDDYDDRRPRRRARRQDRETQPEGTGLQLGLGVGSLSVGIIGLIFALIPCLGFFSWPLCAIGLVLGVVALIIAISKGAGSGLPIAGTAVSGVALAISLLWVFVIARTVNQAGQQFNVNMQQFAKEMQKAAEQAQAEMQRQQKLQGQNPFNFPAAKAPAGPPTPVHGELTLAGNASPGRLTAEAWWSPRAEPRRCSATFEPGGNNVCRSLPRRRPSPFPKTESTWLAPAPPLRNETSPLERRSYGGTSSDEKSTINLISQSIISPCRPMAQE